MSDFDVDLGDLYQARRQLMELAATEGQGERWLVRLGLTERICGFLAAAVHRHTTDAPTQYWRDFVTAALSDHPEPTIPRQVLVVDYLIGTALSKKYDQLASYLDLELVEHDFYRHGQPARLTKLQLQLVRALYEAGSRGLKKNRLQLAMQTDKQEPRTEQALYRVKDLANAKLRKLGLGITVDNKGTWILTRLTKY